MRIKKVAPVSTYFLPGWEKELEEHNLKADKLPKVYICSPLGAPTVEEIWHNMCCARELMYYATQLFECVAVAPHAYVPILLNDTVTSERCLGLKFGTQLLELCSVLFVCGDRVSKGMAAEIKLAAEKAVPICIFNPSLEEEVRKICKGMQPRINLHYGGEYIPLSVPSPKEFFAKEKQL